MSSTNNISKQSTWTSKMTPTRTTSPMTPITTTQTTPKATSPTTSPMTPTTTTQTTPNATSTTTPTTTPTTPTGTLSTTPTTRQPRPICNIFLTRDKIWVKLSSKKIWFSFWCLLCTALCIWQIYLVCQIYFSYETTVTIGNEQVTGKPTFTETPGITMCFYKEALWRRSILQPLFPEIFQELDNIRNESNSKDTIRRHQEVQ